MSVVWQAPIEDKTTVWIVSQKNYNVRGMWVLVYKIFQNNIGQNVSKITKNESVAFVYQLLVVVLV